MNKILQDCENEALFQCIRWATHEIEKIHWDRMLWFANFYILGGKNS